MKLNIKRINLSLVAIFTAILPLIGFSQKANQHWTTPIENVQFTDSVIIYTYTKQMPYILFTFQPIQVDNSVIRIIEANTAEYIYPGDLKSYFDQLTSYLAEGDIRYASNNDKYKILEVSVLVILHQRRGHTKLPDNFENEIELLQNDLVTEIARNANLVYALFEFYNKNMIGK
jgi:hypothetical protein